MASMFRLGFAAVGIALVSITPAGQLPAPVTGSGLIGGRVIDAQTRAPISAATVDLFQTRTVNGDRPGYATTKTDSAGKFVFQALPAGQFSITSTAANYLLGAVGKLRQHGFEQWVSLRAGQRIDTLTIELTRAAR